jgi:hypothetical protein
LGFLNGLDSLKFVKGAAIALLSTAFVALFFAAVSLAQIGGGQIGGKGGVTKPPCTLTDSCSSGSNPELGGSQIGGNGGSTLPPCNFTNSCVTTPGWLPAGMTIGVNPATNQCYDNGSLVALSSCVTVSRAAQETCDTGSAITYAANNTMCPTGDIWGAETNLVIQSQALQTSGNWALTNLSVTTGLTAPDGSTNAQTIVESAATNALHGIEQSFTKSGSSLPYCVTAYIKSTNRRLVVTLGDNSGNYIYDIFDPVHGQTATWVSPGGWGVTTPPNIVARENGFYQIIFGITSNTSTALNLILRTDNGTRSAPISQQYTGDGVSGVTIWQVDLKQTQTCGGPAIPTTTVAVTRPADVVTATGDLASAIHSSTGTAIENTIGLTQGVANTLLDANGTVLLGQTTANLLNASVGASLSTGNFGRWWEQSGAGISWNGSGRNLNLRGYTTATDATAMTPSGTIHIGSLSGSSAFLNGRMTLIAAGTTKLSSTALAADLIDGSPIIPPQALAWGYGTNTFLDKFKSASTIDVNNSITSGFNWYTNNAWANVGSAAWADAGATQASDITVANGVMTLATDRSGFSEGLNTAVEQTSGTSWGGTAFSGGFYWETYTQFTPQASTGAWPADWSISLELLTQSCPSFGGLGSPELDTMEDVSGDGDLWASVHAWSGSGCATSNSSLTTVQAADSNWHRYGLLWVTQATNGGVNGVLEWYYDEVLVKSCTYSSSGASSCNPSLSPSNPTGVLSTLDSQHFPLILGTGTSWPMSTNYVFASCLSGSCKTTNSVVPPVVAGQSPYPIGIP